MKAIGIDIGTTTISGVVFDTGEKRTLEARTVSNGSFIRTDREWERIQDAAVIAEKAETMLSELFRLHPDAAAIGLTGQMHGILYTDGEGRAVSPLYTWQDGRGNLPDENGKSLADRVWESCGIKAASGYGLLTHLYNSKKGLVPERAACLCTIADYVGMLFTGRKRALMHSSNAASIGFFDGRENCFRADVLEQLGMDLSLLPEVTDSFSLLGTWQGIPVAAGIGDNQASFLGSVGMRERTLLLNMGTGGQISVLSEQYFEAPGIEARPFVKGKYLLVGSSLCGGRAYAILEHFLRSYVKEAGAEDGPQYGVMERLAEKGMREQAGVKVCTTFKGTRVNPEQRGSITDITEDNFTPQALVYGVLEGMARELCDMYGLIRRGTGIRAENMVGSGNGLRKNPVLQEIFRRMFEAEFTLSACEEEAACGAALAGASAGQEERA